MAEGHQPAEGVTGGSVSEPELPMFALVVAALGAVNGPERGPSKPEPPAVPCVEFDMNPLPCTRGGWRLTITVLTDRVEYTDKVGPTVAPIDLFDFCDGFVIEMKRQGFKVEIADKSKIRVYGVTKDGKFYPATEGKVTSPDLNKDELPKVTNPPKA